MLAILSGVVALLFLLWMFYDFIWMTPPSVERQLGKPDQPIEYNLLQSVSKAWFAWFSYPTNLPATMFGDLFQWVTSAPVMDC